MKDIVIILALIILIVLMIFLIFLVVDLRRSNTILRGFIKRTEENLEPALIELRYTLENVKKITGDVGAVTGEVRLLSGTLGGLRGDIEKIYGMVDDLGASAKANMSGLKEGVKAGVITFFRNIVSKEG